MKSLNSALSFGLRALTLVPVCAIAQHDLEQHRLEEVFVSGELQKAVTDTALPVDVLSGEALRKALAASLGETLENQPGVRSASFGSGVGLPVIRGQSGPRVSVRQNGLGSMDAAAASQDHANSVDPLIAERIEIIRGPATLLYGNGAIGGVVNVIDNRVPETLPQALTGAAELRHNTAASENAGAFKLDSSFGDFAWHLDGAVRDSGNTEIPGWAINPATLEHDAHRHEEDEDHAEEEAEEEIENTYGYIANSDTQSHSVAAGGSWIGERGFAGFSVSRLSNEYGLPPGSHLHTEELEDAHDEVDEPHDMADDHDLAEDDHSDHSDVRIDLTQTRYEFKGGIDTAGFFNRLNARIAYNDYKHTEFARDEEHGGIHESAHFTNRGTESRLTAHYARSSTWDGVVGTQVSDTTYAVEGEEGFIPRTDIQSFGLFALESITLQDWIYEFGVRLEQMKLAPEGACDRDELSWSASIAAIWSATETVNLSASASRAQRSASVEERYSNVDTAVCALDDEDHWQVHSPTGLVELGNPDLAEETSNNFELSLHKHLGEIHGQVSVYFNRLNDYIYLAEDEAHSDFAIAHYHQQDAEFYGYEAEVTWPTELSPARQLEFTLFSDGVHAELTTGDYLPRISPRRSGLSVSWIQHDWSVTLRATQVADADRVAVGETTTDGYTLLDLHADYHLDWGNQEWLLFARGFNLLDETIRNHTSFAKDLAPEPGRGLKAGIRVSF